VKRGVTEGRLEAGPERVLGSGTRQTLNLPSGVRRQGDLMGEGSVTDIEVKQAWDALKKTGAYIKGHFERAPGGPHYGDYFQIPVAMQYTRNARLLSAVMGRVMRLSGMLHGIDATKRTTVLAPVDAGVPVAFWAGEQLDVDRIIWAVQANAKWRLRPFINLDKADQVIIVDDLIHTGKTLGGVVEFVKGTGASILGIAVIVDRRDDPKKEFKSLRVHSALQLPAVTYDAKKCEPCKKGEKLVKLG
jgi:orotate phosphoribosyltransferase